MRVNYQKLAKILNHDFRNKSLLERALTHPSLQNSNQRKFNYERLEFLGDTILCFVISEILYNLSEDNEGKLAKRRASLVCRASLAEISDNLGLREFILMSKGEEELGGRDNEANLENVLEALIAALYLDAGLEIVKNFIYNNWQKYFDHKLILSDDPKSSVQELIQKQGKNLPKYILISQEGLPHEPIFTVELQIEGEESVKALGNSKKIAEKNAAKEFLRKCGIENKAL